MMVHKYLILIGSSLLYLIPFVLLTGSFLPDLFLSLIAILFIIGSIINKSLNYYNSKFFILFILFYIFLLICSILSENPFFSLKSSIAYFRFGFFSIAVWWLIENNKKLIPNFTKFLLLTFIFAIITGFIQYFYGFNLIGTHIDERLTLTLNDKLILGGYLIRLLPLLLAMCIINFGITKKNFILYIILIVFTFILVFLSGERTAFAISILIFFFIFYIFPKKNIFKLIVLIIPIFILTILFIFKPNLLDRQIIQTFNDISKQTINSDLLITERNFHIFSAVHESHYKSAIKMFKNNPILGIGPNLYRIKCYEVEYKINSLACSTHPHNTFIQLASETGTIGLFFVSLIFIYLIIILRRKMKLAFNGDITLVDYYQILLILSIVVSLFPFLPSLNFFNNWINVIYYLPVGFLLFSINNQK